MSMLWVFPFPACARHDAYDSLTFSRGISPFLDLFTSLRSFRRSRLTFFGSISMMALPVSVSLKRKPRNMIPFLNG